MTMYYSITPPGFYPEENLEGYRAAGVLPDTIYPISDADYDAYFNPPEGYMPVFDEKGPRIGPIPPRNYVDEAEQQRDQLRREFSTATYAMNLKLMAGRKLTAAETSRLNEWLNYSDALESTDLSSAPDVTWPQKPA